MYPTQGLLDSFLRGSQKSYTIDRCGRALSRHRNNGTGAGIMFGHRTRVFGAVALLAGFFSILSSSLTAENHSAHTGMVRIGMISSLFSDIPEATVTAMMQPFSALME